MAVGSLLNQMRNEPRRLIPQHTKTLPKTQLSHDIESQPIKHFAHINPLLHIHAPFHDLVDKNLNIPQDQILHALQRILRERCRENTTLASMLDFVDCVVRVVDTFYGGEGVVEGGLLEGAREW